MEQYFFENCEIDYDRYHADGSNAIYAFKKIHDAYTIETRSARRRAPLFVIDNLDLLFNTIFKLVELADIQPDDSPIRPYLLKAKSLDGNLELPFINLENRPIHVVSLIDITNEAE